MRWTVGSGLGQQPMTPGGTFIPRIDSGVQYVNNLNLAADNEDPVNTWGLELAPGMYASYLSSSVTAAIDYSVIGRVWGDSDYNDVSQIGDANARWIAVPDLFYIDGQASITDDVINPTVGLNYGEIGVFGQDNLSQQAVVGITPTLDKQFREFNLLASYSYGRVWYFDQGSVSDQPGFLGQDNSQDQAAYVGIGNIESGRKLTGTLFYSWQYTDYENALPFRNEQAGVDLAWQFRPTMAVVGEYGLESDLDKSTTQGGLDSAYWEAGLRWQPDSRTSLEARYGDRFFGHSYYFNFSRTSRMLEFSALYSEVPTVYTQILSFGDFTPGELPPSVEPEADFGRLNSDPYVAKNATVTVTAVGSRTRASLQGFQYSSDYIRNSFNDSSFTGGAFWVDRQMAANLSATFWFSYTSYDQSELDEGTPITTEGTYDDTQFIARLFRESLGRKLLLAAEAGYLNRSGSVSYDGWWVGLRARWFP